MTDQKLPQNLYDQVVEVTQQYLGPAADRFVNRQIQNHLKKSPEKLDKSDLKSLIDWIQLAFSIIADDDQMVVEYMDALTSLASAKPNHGRHHAENKASR